ncbi:glycosyltransferase family 4 protein [Aeromicrobium alkaliterrae]|uniref:Glycosyltransferase family 4 protein n=1 Tax=Aeromicrobium alkaliterrae TaxID=302168 RepID=A0ABP4W523_9ACTN
MSSHRRVVRVLGPLPPPVHGASAVTDRMVGALRERQEIDVVTVDIGDGAGLPRRLLALLGGLLRFVPRLVLRRRDAVYLGGAGGELLWYQAMVVLLARLAGHRTVFHHHNSSYLTRHLRAMAAIVRFGGPGLEHVVLSPDMGRRLQARYAGARTVHVCSNAGLMTEAAPTGRAPVAAEGPVVLGHLSNLTREKGVHTAIDTLRRLLDAGVDARLVLAGPCVGDDVEALVTAAVAELGGRLEWLGRLDAPQVEAFYRSIDLFVFPSTYVNEAEPLVVLDALRHGVPAVAHPVGCLGDVLPVDHVVPVDADLAQVVLDLVRGGGLEPSASAAARFDERRTAAITARRELVDRLAG